MARSAHVAAGANRWQHVRHSLRHDSGKVGRVVGRRQHWIVHPLSQCLFAQRSCEREGIFCGSGRFDESACRVSCVRFCRSGALARGIAPRGSGVSGRRRLTIAKRRHFLVSAGNRLPSGANRPMARNQPAQPLRPIQPQNRLVGLCRTDSAVAVKTSTTATVGRRLLERGLGGQFSWQCPWYKTSARTGAIAKSRDALFLGFQVTNFFAQ
jgi:hypothetical protein